MACTCVTNTRMRRLLLMRNTLLRNTLLLCLLLGATSGQECSDGELRLFQTNLLQTANAGRLDICLNRQWGTIRVQDRPNEFWSLKNVLVACRQLNFTAGLTAIPPEQVTLEDQLSSGPVHYADVVCDGTERSLSDCPSTVISDSSHSNDVYIVCLPGTEIYSGLHTLPSGSAIGGDLRLVGDEINGQGVVEIYTDLLGWTSICPDNAWTDSDAEVICEQLGYDSGSSQTITLQTNRIAARRVYAAECTHTSSQSGRISAGPCSFLHDTANVCPLQSNVYAGVMCTNKVSDVARLFSRTEEDNRVRGILEVRYNGRWGPVCMSGVGTSTQLAGTICDGFGYSRNQSTTLVLSPESQRSIESRLKPIWLQGLNCTTISPISFDCTHERPLGYGACPVILGVNCYKPPGFTLSASSVVAISFGAFMGFIFICWCTVFVCKSLNKKSEPEHSRHTTGDHSAPRSMTNQQRMTNFVRRMSFDLFPISRSQRSMNSVRDDVDPYKTAPPSYRSAARFPALGEESPPPYSDILNEPPPPIIEESIIDEDEDPEEGFTDPSSQPLSFTVPPPTIIVEYDNSDPQTSQPPTVIVDPDPQTSQPPTETVPPPITTNTETDNAHEHEPPHTHPAPLEPEHQSQLGIPV